MSVRNGLAALVLAAAGAAPAPAWAWGVPGCTNLPEYNRALGALQGMTSACDMSVEEARRVVAAHDGVAPGPPGRRRGAAAAAGRAAAPQGAGAPERAAAASPLSRPAGAQVSSPGAPGGSARARAQSRSRCACRARCSAT